ncbi:MAG: exosortase A [Methylococcales bacterium]
MNHSLPLNSTKQYWNSFLPCFVVGLLLLLAIHWQTLLSMISTWWNIGTYAHGFVIFPISVWIAWGLRASISTTFPKPTIKGIMALLAISLIWLIANQVGLIGIQQFALISLILVFAMTLLGGAVYKKLLFPLLFLYLAVPFGDFLIKPMMEFTADFTVILLRFSGIPVYRNGLFFMLPTGKWSVVAACSGVRYLIASLTVGILFAYFSYSSWRKRLLFTAVSIITPIIANCLRAYLIVLIGHFSHMKLATGIDHFVYGWLFFGIIIAIMMWIGSKFQDYPQPYTDEPFVLNNPDQIPKTADSSAFNISTLGDNPITITALALLVIAIGPFLAYVLNQQPQQQINLTSISLPETITPWSRTNQIGDWQPNYSGQTLQLSRVYQNQLGSVQLIMIFYANEGQGNELTNGRNSLLPADDSDWNLVLESVQRISHPSKINLHESLIEANQYRLIWQFNWVNGQLTINDSEAKWIAVKNRMRGRNNHSVAVIISTQSGEDTIEAQQRLTEFMQTMSKAIFKILAQFESLGTEIK